MAGELLQIEEGHGVHREPGRNVMLNLELQANEIDVLRDVIQSDLAELRHEIYRTDHRAFRDKLRDREALLAGILDRVERLLPTVSQNAA
jgi:hypothetical protein